MARLLLFLLLGIAGCTNLPNSGPATATRNTDSLILLSLDAFRWDYMQKYDAPNLRALARDGVHARRMTSCFPSKTFPSHYSIATGLRPAHHGIASNTFYDPALAATFVFAKHECAIDGRWWQGGEPIWITAALQGVRSGCFFLARLRGGNPWGKTGVLPDVRRQSHLRATC